MKVQLDNDYLIETDAKQFLLKKCYSNSDNKAIGYYLSLESALQGYLRVKMLDSEANSFTDLVAEIQDLKESVRKLLEPFGKLA